MNPELREAIGEAVYSALDLDENERLGWNKTSEKIREQCRKCGEKAIEAYKRWTEDNAEGYLNIAGIDRRGEE